MAPHTGPKTTVNARIHAIVDFATKLHALLVDRSSIPTSLRRELEAHIRQIPDLNHAAFATHALSLDARGSDLWNAAAPLLDTQCFQPVPTIKASDDVRLGLHVRLFALILLHVAHATLSPRAKEQHQQIRVMKTALRAAKLCLGKDVLEHAHTAMEIFSQYSVEHESESLIQLSSVSPENGDKSVTTMMMLTAECHLLRLLHAWKSDRLDLAEYFYPKIWVCGRPPSADLALKAADMLYKLAKSLANEKKTELAIKWYDRAFTLLSDCNVEHLSQDAMELLLSVGVALTSQLLVLDLPSTRQRAWEVVDQLEKNHDVCNRIAVPLIRFKLLSSESQVDVQQISQTLLRLTKLVVLTDDSFRLVMKTINKAVETSLDSALVVLKSFICIRIVPEARSNPAIKAHTWLEIATVSYILHATSRPDRSSPVLLEDLCELVNSIHSIGDVKFTTKATHASQTLIWKASCTSDHENAISWIRLLCHPLFEHAGPSNKACIGRKLMRTAFEEGDLALALDAFMELPVASQNEPLTQYLAFKLALRTHDQDLAMSSLNILTKAAGKDSTCLYACVLEAQQSDSRSMAVAGLQAILDERPQGIHLPSLLRCTARLLISEFDIQPQNSDAMLLEVLPIFETAAKCIDDLSNASGNDWRSEVQWWSKSTYNLAVRLSATVRPESLVRLLDVCTTFLERSPDNSSSKRQERVDHRKLLCAFLATTALIVLGRSNSVEGEEYTLQCFLHAQQRIEVFKAIMKNSQDQPRDDQANARHLAILKFELECILRLEKWSHLGEALQACLDAEGSGRWDTLADLLIIVHEQLDEATKGAHTDMMTQLLQRAINDTWKKEKDMSKVARWLRFTFVLCLGHSQGSFSFKLLEQAASMAENGQRGKQDRYPESELKWLSTTSFNHAIDLLINEEEHAAVSWMDSALALARWSDDNGFLHASFTRKKEIALERVKTQ